MVLTSVEQEVALEAAIAVILNKPIGNKSVLLYLVMLPSRKCLLMNLYFYWMYKER